MHANVGMSMSESHTTKDCSMDVEHLYNVLSSICPLPLLELPQALKFVYLSLSLSSPVKLTLTTGNEFMQSRAS